MTLRTLLAAVQPIERIAAGFFIVLLVGAWFHDALYRSLWVIGVLLMALIWGVALLLAALSAGWAVRGKESATRRWRAGLAMPGALLAAAFLTGPAMAAGSWSSARWQLWRLCPAYEAAARAQPNQPLAFPYLEGIPDGGVAIVHWRGDPRRLDSATQVRLTGERILDCRWLAPGYHLCGYD